MLNRNIFVSHMLSLILRMNQNIVQILADSEFSAGHLHSGSQLVLRILRKMRKVNFHLFDQFRDQSILLLQQCNKQMLLFQLLITVITGKLFTIVDCLSGLLCKFLNVHSTPSFFIPVNASELYIIYLTNSFEAFTL